MSRRLSWFRVATFAAAAALLAACGSSGGKSGSSSSNSTGSLRLANLTASTGLVLNASGQTDTTVTFTTGTVAAGSTSSYEKEKTQTYTVGIASTDGSLAGITQPVGLTKDTDITLLAFARAGTLSTYTLYDTLVTPASGFATLSVSNAASDAGTLDVYLVSPGSVLNGLSPAYSTLYGVTTSGGKAQTAGTYDMVVTASGKPGDVRLTIPSVTLKSGDIVALALTPTLGGGLVDGAFVYQGGVVQRYPSTRARVRVVGAFPAGPSSNSIVSVTVGNTAIASVTAPSAGSYKLVPGDTSSYAVSVDNVAVANLPQATFANGGDYTILVYGNAATPSVTVLTDSNLLLSSGAASLRLVNAAVTGGGITLNDDYVPINQDVQYGTASTYSPATPSSSSLIEISSPVAAFPGYTATDFNVVSGGVYTVFVLGTTSAPVVSFARDR